MLKLTPSPTFTTPVEISVPGSAKPETIDIEFRHKTKDELVTFVNALGDGRQDDEILAEVIVSWKRMDCEYSVEALRTLLKNYTASGREILESYLASVAESRRKNSPR